MRVDGTKREVLGHALREPQRPAVPDHVELEGVHDLVAEYVVGLAEVADKRHDDAPAERFREPADSLADFRVHDVGLLEVPRRCIQDQRLLAAQVVGQHCAQPGVPALGHTAGQASRVGGVGVVLDREVLGAQHLELKRPVPDLVAAELLSGGRARGRQDDECHDRGET